MGGLGFAPSANIGLTNCYFEPVHGSGPRLKPNSANPSAMFLTISLLMSHFGYFKEAKAIQQAIINVVRKGRFITYDVGGRSSTVEMASAIISAATILMHPKIKSAAETTIEARIAALSPFSSTEISDALDACGVEGALLHIKPLTQGHKLIGPAYTIQYSPYQKIDGEFKKAADYIDNIPAHAVIVIDNQARVDCTVWGGILTRAALIKEISGTVVNGAVRDVNQIRDTGYPLFCIGQTMRSGKNRVHKTGEQCPIIINDITIYPGDFIVGDDHGVIKIPAHMIDEVCRKAHAIQRTEKKIIASINNGARLEKARQEHFYEQPWLDV